MFAVIIYCCAAVLAILIVLWYCTQMRYIMYLKDIPGPIRLPLVGNAFDFPSTVALLPKLMEYRKKYGDIFQIGFGFQQPNLVISDHDLLQFLLSSTQILDKSINYRFLHSWLGHGLLTSTGSRWKSHRKMIVPAFHFKILEQFVEVFDKNSDVFIEKLAEELNSESFDIYNYVTLLALDIICETALGTHIDAQNNSHSEYVESVRLMCNLLIERAFSAVKQYDSLHQFTEAYRKEKYALRVLHQATISVIQRRKKDLADAVHTDNKEEDFGIKKKLAFLDLLLQSKINGQPLSDEVLREEVDTFMFEGHDTVSSAISFILYNLSKYPEVQEKALAELRSIFANDKNRRCAYTDLHEMKYLEAVIKESLRLYPSVPVYGRTLPEDVKYNGMLIPRGTIMLVFAFGIARNENLFPNPEQFNPERFILSNLSSLYPYAYLPFSAGPRNCIGQKFAMQEMKFVVSKMLRHYEILPALPDHELLLSAEVTLKSATGWRIRIKRREF